MSPTLQSGSPGIIFFEGGGGFAYFQQNRDKFIFFKMRGEDIPTIKVICAATKT
ncbi:MAG: hypothetical protein KKA54_16930 [Proteobacteria bacterium]|nr:hypothetical protein [Pseudomonadota bacterium]